MPRRRDHHLDGHRTPQLTQSMPHFVKDRMDRTGARWGLQGAEAVLKLRALRSNGDFDSYWQFHLAHEQQRLHQTRYANSVIPRAG